MALDQLAYSGRRSIAGCEVETFIGYLVLSRYHWKLTPMASDLNTVLYALVDAVRPSGRITTCAASRDISKSSSEVALRKTA
jgi:hypothetical protein